MRTLTTRAPVAPTGDRLGIAAAVAAYLQWGLYPFYFKALEAVSTVEIVAHRVVWSFVLLLFILPWTGRLAGLREALADRRRVAILAFTATLITGNWIAYVWAVNAGQVLDASLGYFLGPLCSVLLGVVVLGERLSKVQLAAVTIAALAVLNLIIQLGVVPKVAILLGVSFSLYGLLRKQLPVGPTTGLLVECALVLPCALLAMAWLGADGRLAFLMSDRRTDLLLLLAGVFTVGPLWCFNVGTKRVGLVTVGLLQYIAPTMLFFEGIFLFGEPLSVWRLVAFVLIWAALALYTADGVLRSRRAAG